MPEAIRRYGPVRAPGTAIVEEMSGQSIIASPYGVVAWTGILEKGPTDELIECNGPSDFARKCGGRIEDSLVPDCSQDYWTASRGAGKQFLVRVTDGTGRASTITLKTRETTGHGYGRWRDAFTVAAKSVGRWGSAYNRRIGDMPNGYATDLTATTLDTGLTLKKDEFKGGTLVLSELPGNSYTITGNTVAGIVTVTADSDMLTDFGAGTDEEFVLFRNNYDYMGNLRKLAVLVKNGGRDPVGEFGLEVYWNGVKTLNYENLSMDPDSDVYYVNVINNDPSNHEITVTNLFSGAYTADVRPANQAGLIPTAGLTSNVLTIEPVQTYIDSGNTGDGTAGSFTYGASVQKDVLTLTCTNATVPATFSVASATQDGAFADATAAAAYVAHNAYSVGFTVTAGSAAFVLGDKIYIVVEPLVTDEAIGGKLFYNTTDSPFDYLDIIDNTPTTVTVRPNVDLTAVSAVGKEYRLEFPEGMEKGYDGSADVDDSDYIQVFDQFNSIFNQLQGKKLGLVKFALPGIQSTTVQKAARTYCGLNNFVFRGEITKTLTNEGDAVNFVHNTMGVNDFEQFIFPSYYYKKDPDRKSGYKNVPLTGLVQGVEAAFAYAYGGYHRAAAGVTAILEGVVKLETGDVNLNGEILNPAGLQYVIKKDGNWVIWGDRVPASSTGTFWKHKREQLSHYERVLFENFDWLIFTINDEDSDGEAKAALQAYFLPEWRPKRAIRGDTFEDAVKIQVDSENNTDATRAAGEKHAKIMPRLADTTERFVITVSPQGVFEGTEA